MEREREIDIVTSGWPVASLKRFVLLGSLSPMHVASDLASDTGTRQLAQRAFQHAMPNLLWLCSWILHLLAAAFLRQHLRLCIHPSTQLHMRCTRGESWTNCTSVPYFICFCSLLSCFSSSLIHMFGLFPGQTQTPRDSGCGGCRSRSLCPRRRYHVLGRTYPLEVKLDRK